MKSFTIDIDTLQTVAAAVLDENAVLLEANAGFLRLLPATFTRPIGAKVARFFIQPAFATLSAAAESGADVSHRGLLTIGDHAGKTRTLNGRVWRTAGTIRILAEYDIAALEALNDAILDLNRESSVARHALSQANVSLSQREEQSVAASLTDALTGVGNRRRFDQALEAEISRVRRNGGVLSAIMLDIDHFKRINDQYGHGAGDKVLANLGTLLQSQFRPTDIATRYGGEEFVVLMPHASLAQAASKAEQLRSLLAGQIMEPLENAVTASFGVAQLLGEEDREGFLVRIDTALYQAKAEGRNRVVVAAPAKGLTMRAVTD